MTHATEDLTTMWEPVSAALEPGATVRHRASGAPVLHREGDELAVLAPRGLCGARHRRALHRLGFRRSDLVSDEWVWRVPPALVEAVLAQLDDDDASARGRPGTAAYRLHSWPIVDRLIRARAVIVLRDVFGWAPDEVLVVEEAPDELDVDDELDRRDGPEPDDPCRCLR